MEPRIDPRSLAATPGTRLPARNGGAAPRPARGALALGLLLLVLAAGACGGPAPGASPASAAPSAPPASAAPVETPDEAVAAIRAHTPWFDGIEALDPNLIGQAASWTAEPTDEQSIRVTFEVGWGDCQAGCIDRHTWTWDVASDGSLDWVGEDGSEVTPDQAAALVATAKTPGVGGRVTGGPTCPVEVPGDPACAARLVGGAVLVVTDADGNEIAGSTSDASGFYRIALPAGEYTLTAGPVEGFMSGPAPTPFTVAVGTLTGLDLSYDTGIR